ncbi:DEAD/DEAH box helicase [Tropheryma whipplei]|uniref:DEAD/DEAH box helicase n=1 Tax=Tropheryma whipplei TaxID=2039 RepID=UPI0002EFE938|nr:DEAD/DEAH box helicase [Tropheryma whipplei]
MFPEIQENMTNAVIKDRTSHLLSALARTVREVEMSLVRKRIGPSSVMRFHAVALLLRQERARVKSDPDITDTVRTELIRRLDGLAAVMVRIAARDTALMSIVTPDAPVSDGALLYRRRLLSQIGVIDSDGESSEIREAAPPPPSLELYPQSVKMYHATHIFRPPGPDMESDLVPIIRLANWDLVGSVFKAFSQGGASVCKSLPAPSPFLDRLAPDGLSMMPHQAGFVESARLGHRSFLLADEPGLGKTAQSLLAAGVTNSFPLLVVVPNVVKLNWVREAKMWLPGRRATIISGDDLDAFADIFVINYEMLDRHMLWMVDFGFAGMVVDEAHLIKNFSSQRSGNVLALAQHIRKKCCNPLMIALTGTPVINSVEDFRALWLFLGWLAGPRGRDLSPVFVSELEKTGLTPEDPGFSETVRDVMGHLGIVRRRKTQVAKDLPERMVVDLPVELDGDAFRSVKNAEDDLADALYAQYISLKHLRIDDYQIRLKAVERFAVESKDSSALNIFSIVRKIGITKAPLAIDFTIQMLDSVGKIVFFAKHIEVMNMAEEMFCQQGIRSVSIRGSQTPNDRKNALRTFDEDPDTRVAICSLTAAGLGINLQVASNVVLSELSWTAAEQGQAIDRLHRIGQTEPVTAWRILGAGTVDIRMAALVDSKSNDAILSLDGGDMREVQQESLHIRSLLDLLDDRIRKAEQHVE